MCTVTWQFLDDGDYELFENRDEQRSRLPAEPPTIHHTQGVSFVAPLDGDAGGTWIGVNEHGVALTLLNGRHRAGEEPPRGFASRGLLVYDLLALPTADAVTDAFRSADLADRRGFQLLLFEPASAPVVLAWDGRTATVDPAGDPPRVSSSRDPVAARAARGPTYERLVADPGITTNHLLAFHRSHEPERGPFSVCMHRKDARTVSASHVRVGREAISFAYAPGPPCRTPFGEPVRVPRARGMNRP